MKRTVLRQRTKFGLNWMKLYAELLIVLAVQLFQISDDLSEQIALHVTYESAILRDTSSGASHR